jgi:hypothetical protein
MVVDTTAAQAAGATEDIMTAYFPRCTTVLQHLPQHCIDDWSDFSRWFITNFQSLSNKLAQPWDLKSIRR